jgi:hypothetical protein
MSQMPGNGLSVPSELPETGAADVVDCVDCVDCGSVVVSAALPGAAAAVVAAPVALCVGVAAADVVVLPVQPAAAMSNAAVIGTAMAPWMILRMIPPQGPVLSMRY